LVHDDIIDRDATRRGHPTVHAAFDARGREQFDLSGEEAAHYGASVAILAGDLQQSWSYALLCDLARRGVSPELVVELVSEMANVLTPSLMEGEMLDVQFSLEPSDAVSSDDVLEMLRKKTGALLRYGAWAGAMIGAGGSPAGRAHAETLGRFAELCGVAFQLHDDVLGLVADEETLGKPVGSDLREGKQTYVTRLAMERADDMARREISAAWGNRAATQEQIERAISAVKELGAIEQTRSLAEDLISQAAYILSDLPDTPQRQLLKAWAGFLLAREY
jgi:geranylgeranyl diphosphate synthase type I